MAVLTATARKRIPAKSFALPGGRYPINDPAHARNALARASQHASPAEKATIRRKVKAKYPAIDVSGLKKMKANGAISQRAAEKNGLSEEREESGEEEPETASNRYKDATQRIYGD
jgi:hypothetical protein